MPGDGGPAAEGPTADPSTNPTLKPASAAKTTTTTTTKVSKTTSVKPSKPKFATATSSSLPKTSDTNWLAVSQALFLLGTALLSIVHSC